MGTLARMSDKIITLDAWDEHVVAMEETAAGFWERQRLRAMFNLFLRGYQFGYEIAGYGTVVGYCATHEPHPDEAGALECGRRFLNGEPELRKDRKRRRRKR